MNKEFTSSIVSVFATWLSGNVVALLPIDQEVPCFVMGFSLGDYHSTLFFWRVFQCPCPVLCCLLQRPHHSYISSQSFIIFATSILIWSFHLILSPVTSTHFNNTQGSFIFPFVLHNVTSCQFWFILILLVLFSFCYILNA